MRDRDVNFLLERETEIFFCFSFALAFCVSFSGVCVLLYCSAAGSFFHSFRMKEREGSNSHFVLFVIVFSVLYFLQFNASSVLLLLLPFAVAFTVHNLLNFVLIHSISILHLILTNSVHNFSLLINSGF